MPLVRFDTIAGLITGRNSGIGLATARLFVAAGAKVVGRGRLYSEDEDPMIKARSASSSVTYDRRTKKE